jgi:hypothetical protein
MQPRQGYPLSLNARGLHDSPQTYYVQHSAWQHYAANAAKDMLEGTFLIGHDVFVLCEFLLADAAFAALLDDLALQQFSHFR